MLEPLTSTDAVLVGTSRQLLAILTSSDIVRTLYRLTSTYLLLEEIELALRKVIELALTEEQLPGCIQRALAHLYANRDDQMPQTLRDLSFGEYIALIDHGANWPFFQPVLGSTRAMVRARLRPIIDLRNDLLHFRRPVTHDDTRQLAGLRDWLLIKLTTADARRNQAS